MDLVLEGKEQRSGSRRSERSGELAEKAVPAGRMDGALIYTALALVCVGLTSVYTASAALADLETGNSLVYLFKQVLATGIGLVGLLFCARLSFHKWKQWSLPLAMGAIGLLLITMFAGKAAYGAERWIALPFGFQFQPSDIAKVAAIFLMAHATSQKQLWTTTTIVNLGLVGVMMGLIYQQPNLSVTLIVAMVSFALLFVNGLNLGATIILIPVACQAVWHKIQETPYQLKRIEGWLDPWKDPMEKGYNLIQSYFAIASGGLFGVGLGNSVQKLYYLPFQHTDFIFSVICEEWGFFGALIVVGLFVMLGWRGFRIAWHCPHPFGKMLAFGLTLAIVLQALINICVTSGLMPVTGVTLPLISYGGTSMIVTLGMIGILLNVSRYQNRSLSLSGDGAPLPA